MKQTTKKLFKLSHIRKLITNPMSLNTFDWSVNMNKSLIRNINFLFGPKRTSPPHPLSIYPFIRSGMLPFEETTFTQTLLQFHKD